ncbi:MAG TPA: hypothetical protein VNU46_04385 [Gemmatimonadaceae bacterium]|jgi:hypothetical protein|nr:hypothetical protein [Gemmatimonadaceae bacterium]
MSTPIPISTTNSSSTNRPSSTPPRPPALVRVEGLIGAAKAFIGVPEQGGNNLGQMVELFLREVGLPAGEPWCAAFVYHVGFWSQFDLDTGTSTWPLPATGACQSLADAARVRGALMERPVRGDLFLLWIPERGRFAHTGIVVDVTLGTGGYGCHTIEGNTNDDGSADGWKTGIRYRCFGPGTPHRFIRWTAIDGVVSAREGA